jgi:hypothetical protein
VAACVHAEGDTCSDERCSGCEWCIVRGVAACMGVARDESAWGMHGVHGRCMGCMRVACDSRQGCTWRWQGGECDEGCMEGAYA